MPTHVVDHPLSLSPDQKVALFQQQFGSKYEVYASKLIGADLIVKKSGWSGIAVRFKEKNGQTQIRWGAMAPSAAVRILALGLIPILILYLTSWKALQQEVGDFIKGSIR